MTNTLNEVQLAQIVGAVLKALQTQGAASKDAAPVARVGNSLEAKDKALVNVAFAVGAFRSIRSC